MVNDGGPAAGLDLPRRWHRLRRRIWQITDGLRTEDLAERIYEWGMSVLILSNVLAVVLGSIPEFWGSFGAELEVFESASVILFSIEYLARLWACVEDPEYRRPILGRLRFAFTPLALIDLLAIAPYFFSTAFVDFRFAPSLRLFRVLRIAKLGRYLESLQLFGRVVVSKREELLSTLILAGIVLICSASAMYYVEHESQPEQFPHIPAAIWWAVTTLTTVGYGDIYPITASGRFLASISAVLGIGLFALPTAILGTGFLEQIQKKPGASAVTCPHCGLPIADHPTDPAPESVDVPPRPERRA